MKQFLVFDNGVTLSIGKSFVKLGFLNFSRTKKDLFFIEKGMELRSSAIGVNHQIDAQKKKDAVGQPG